MKPNYLVGPLIGMAMFVAYYLFWQSQPHAPARTEARAVDGYLARDGKKEAEAEVAAGRLVLLETGPEISWDAERREIARTRYAVELRRLEAAPTEGFARYVEAFNRVMRPKVLAQHGRGFFDTLHREAIALRESRGAGSGK